MLEHHLRSNCLRPISKANLLPFPLPTSHFAGQAALAGVKAEIPRQALQTSAWGRQVLGLKFNLGNLAQNLSGKFKLRLLGQGTAMLG